MVQRYPTAIVGALALIGAMTVLFGTGGTIGLSIDAGSYIGAARNLLRGYGLSTMSGSGMVNPLTVSAPLYPMLLALLGVFGLDPLDGAKWLNAFFFGATIFLVGHVVHRCTRSGYAAVLGAFLVLTSTGMLYVHMMVFTEPPFLFFGLLGLALLAVNIGDSRVLVAAGAAIGLAFLARYLGAALAITGITGILLLSSHGYARRIKDALTFAVITLFPTAVWFIRNLRVAHVVTGRGVGLHPLTVQHIKPALLTFSSWLIPETLPGIPSVLKPVLVVGAWGGLVILGLALIRTNRRTGTGDAPSPFLMRLTVLLGLYILLYLGVLVATVLFGGFQPGPLAFRHQIPVQVAVITLVLCVGHRLLRGVGHASFLRMATIIFCVGLAGSYLVRATVWVASSHREGLGYSSRQWKRSEIIEKVKALPSDIRVVSNGGEAIYLLTGRPADSLPGKPGPVSGLTESEYRFQLTELGKQLKDRTAVIVYFNEFPGRAYLPSEKELLEALPLTLIDRGADGSIYGGGE